MGLWANPPMVLGRPQTQAHGHPFQETQPKATYSYEEGCVEPLPHGPPYTGFVAWLVFPSRFAGNLGYDWLVIYYFISIIFHGVIITCKCFFLEVPRIEESQDPDSSPRREEVGRRTLGDHGGFLLSFFYRDRFRLLHYSKTSS